jgi:hypothetical protein
LESALKEGESGGGGEGLQTVSWASDKRGADRGGLPLGFAMHTCAAVPGLTRDDYHWHQTNQGAGRGTGGGGSGSGGGETDPAIAEVYFPLLAVVLPKWLNGFVTKSYDSISEGGAAADLRAAAAAAVAAGRNSTAAAAAASNGNSRRRWAADSLAVSPATSPTQALHAAATSAAAAAAAAACAPCAKIRRVIFLVSGFGAPRNASHIPEVGAVQVECS